MLSGPEEMIVTTRGFHVTDREVGAALVVALLLLLVLTLLGISGMNTASLELVMAGNQQYQQNAFQAAESGIERAMITAEFNPATATEPIPQTTISGTSDKYVGAVAAQLSGLPQGAIWGNSWNSFSTYHFEITTTGTSVRNAKAVLTQGVAVLAPHDPSVGPAPNLPSTGLE
jgi:Tfp pilus assembly protein PilX